VLQKERQINGLVQTENPTAEFDAVGSGMAVEFDSPFFGLIYPHEYDFGN
jgi:hypothetical protein